MTNSAPVQQIFFLLGVRWFVTVTPLSFSRNNMAIPAPFKPFQAKDRVLFSRGNQVSQTTNSYFHFQYYTKLISKSTKIVIKQPLFPLHPSLFVLSDKHTHDHHSALRSKTQSYRSRSRTTSPLPEPIQPAFPSLGSPTTASSLCNWACVTVQSDW